MGFYSKTNYSRNVLSLIGAFMVHFVIGTTYTTGNLSIYIASYLRDQGSSVTLQELNILFPLQVTAATCSVILGTTLTLKTNQWLTVCIGNGLVVSSVFITSFLTNATLVIIIYGFFYGVGTGLTYATPLMISWSHFPNHKGRISGIIISGFGFGTTAFNLIATHLINPENKKADEKHQGEKYFSKDVSDNLPETLRILAICYFIISLIGILLLGKIKVKEKNEEFKEGNIDEECPDLKTGIKSKQFWALFMLGLFSNIPGLYVATAYKTFGTSKINNDDFLAITGSMGSLFNGSFRYVWPQIMDKTSFVLTMWVLMLIMTPLLVTFYFIAQYESLFLIWVCGIYACEGGLATLFPSVIAKCFGKVTGARVYGIYYYSVAISALLGFGIQLFIVDSFGYEILFFIMGGLMVIAMFILKFCFVEVNQWSTPSPYKVLKETIK